MRFLISTIIRNRGIHIPTWCDQLIALSKRNKQHTFDLYVFENDSTDNTKQVLNLVQKKLKPYFNVLSIEIEDCDWPYFGSIKAEERVRYLAKARNRTLDKANELVFCIEDQVFRKRTHGLRDGLCRTFIVDVQVDMPGDFVQFF